MSDLFSGDSAAPDSVLIWGPPASGKSRAALDHFLSDSGSVLLTPSSTMAEHIRNQLARSGVAVRPSRVLTLAQFLDRSDAPGAASAAAVDVAIGEALDQQRPGRFQAVAEYRGFRGAVARLLEEIEIGETGGTVPDIAEDLARLFEQVGRTLEGRGMATRNARLVYCERVYCERVYCERAAAQCPGELPSQIVFDGFFSFSGAELRFLKALAAQTRVIVTLPAWAGAEPARGCLISAGFTETRLNHVYRAPAREVFRAATLEQEAEEIARRILDEAARGRPFREMGIVLRSGVPYGGALKTTLARFGIPARFYFADTLAAHPAVDFLAGIVRVLLSGWDHAELLRLIRMPVSGIGATADGDRLDFEVRGRLPGRGLSMPGLPAGFRDSLAGLNGWPGERVSAGEWAVRLKTLRALIPGPIPGDEISAQQLEIWRSTAGALDAFDGVLDETAGAFQQGEQIALAEFWRRAEAALDLTEVRAHDRRRDVVHVMDVFEARQWELPVVFVCGMIERHFPRYHGEDALLGDAARRRAGLKTSVDLQAEERSLFDLAVSRATERVILSFPRFDEKGDATLPSFFLKDLAITQSETRVRPRPSRAVSQPSPEPIQDAELLQHIAEKHRTLSPSSIESFLQCPFQFFAGKTLRLRERPCAPRDRLDMRVQGSILHAALAARENFPLLGAAVFDQEFELEVARRHIPAGYRTEAVRLEMLRHFQLFLDSPTFSLGWIPRVEEKFEIPITPSLSIRGRIDRLEEGPGGEALVIDYKYSAAKTIRDRVKNQDKGEVVQGGLYLLGAVKQFGLAPTGMLYCGLRKDVEWDGWHVPLPGLERIGESCTAARLDELMRAAEAKAIEVFISIGNGSIDVRAADEKKCAWCDYRDICRIETQ